MKQEILKDIGGILTHKYFENNIQKVPTSALITIYDDQGQVKVAQIAASIDSAGTMTYTVLSTIADEVRYNLKAVWEFVVDTVTKYENQLFDIVNQILANPVIDADLIQRAQFLDELNYREILTADSGTAGTIVNSELNEPDDYWTGAHVKIIEGVNLDEERDVVSFVKATNTLGVDPDFTSAIDTTSKFELIRSFQKEIEKAFELFKFDLINKQIKPSRIIDNSQTKEYILLKAIQLICENMTKMTADIWGERAENYKSQYNSKMKVAVFDYDTNDSGNVDSDEASTSFGQIRAGR